MGAVQICCQANGEGAVRTRCPGRVVGVARAQGPVACRAMHVQGLGHVVWVLRMRRAWSVWRAPCVRKAPGHVVQ